MQRLVVRAGRELAVEHLVVGRAQLVRRIEQAPLLRRIAELLPPRPQKS